MLVVQKAQVSQLYGSAAEHIGDLTNRMCQVGLFDWSYDATAEKVTKTLRWVSHGYGFEKDVREQIANNFTYYHEKGRPLGPEWVSIENITAHFHHLCNTYADAHRALPTFNHVTKLGQLAAISLGQWRFADTMMALRELKAILDKGKAAWAVAVSENTTEHIDV